MFGCAVVRDETLQMCNRIPITVNKNSNLILTSSERKKHFGLLPTAVLAVPAE